MDAAQPPHDVARAHHTPPAPAGVDDDEALAWLGCEAALPLSLLSSLAAAQSLLDGASHAAAAP